MKKKLSRIKVTGLCMILAVLFMSISPAHAVFINEIHYDNSGADTGEGVELAGAAGQDLSGWSLQFYNGSSGLVYNNYGLGGVFTDMQHGMGVLSFAISGIQNGSPDGVALVNNTGSVLQFLSYEGSMVANNGAAVGLTSTDMGVAESSSTPVGDSLHLIGSGRDATDFSWVLGPSSFAGINMQQMFIAPTTQLVAPVPEPASGMLFVVGLLLMFCWYQYRDKVTQDLGLPA